MQAILLYVTHSESSASQHDESTHFKDKHMSKLASVGKDETVIPDLHPIHPFVPLLENLDKR